jgi:tol-pal system protein YbgF
MILPPIVLAGMLSGCALQSDLVDMESKLTLMDGDLHQIRNTLETQQKKQLSGEEPPLQRRVEAVENYLKDKTTQIQKNQADSESRMDQLMADLQLIQGRLDENNHLLSEMSQRLDDQSSQVDDLSRRIDGLTGKGPSESQPPKVVLPGGEPGAANPAPENRDEKSGPAEVYNLAYRDYLQGNYDLAVSGFTYYLEQYPSGSLAPNAQYWIGESFYSKKDYSKAVESFEKVSVGFPKNEKVPSALLKAGYAYQELGNLDLARTYLKRVVEQYPYSREASLAKVKLAELK